MSLFSWLKQKIVNNTQILFRPIIIEVKENELGGATHHKYQGASKRCMGCSKLLVKCDPYASKYVGVKMVSDASFVSRSGGNLLCQKCKKINRVNFCVHGYLLKNECEHCPDERVRTIGELKRDKS